MGVKFCGKKRYVTLEWPPREIVSKHLLQDRIMFENLLHTCHKVLSSDAGMNSAIRRELDSKSLVLALPSN